MRSFEVRSLALVRLLILALVLILIPQGSVAEAQASLRITSIGVPTGLSAPSPFAPSTNSMQLFIPPPTSDGGSNFEEWEFKAYPGGITNSIFPGVLSNWESLNLVPGTTYSFTVRFRNAVGWSEESPRSVSISTLALPAPIQSQPTPAAVETPAPVISQVPIPMRLSETCVPEGVATSVTLTGERLSSITSATVDGRTIQLSNISAGSIDLRLPALAVGSYDISYVSSWGMVFHQGALRVCRNPNPLLTSSPTISPTISATISPTSSATTSPTTSPSTSPTSSPAVLVRDEAVVFFAPDSARLSASARRALDELAESHADMKSSFIAVQGFALSAANPDFARSLANRRSVAVVQYLRSLGLNAFFRIEAVANPGGSTAQARRAEINITSRPKTD